MKQSMVPMRQVLWFEDELRRIKKQTLASILASVFGSGKAKENERYSKAYLIDAILAMEQGRLGQEGLMLFSPESLAGMRRQYLEHIASTYWGLGTYKKIGRWSRDRLEKEIWKVSMNLAW